MKKKTKHKLESPLNPLAFNISPNLITIFSMFVMLASAYCIYLNEFMLAGILFLTSGLLDAYDGVVARKYKRASKFGAFFDRVFDRINDAIPMVAIIYFGLVDPLIGLLVFFLVIFASYVSATVEVISKTRVGESISLRPLRTAVMFLGIFFAQFHYAFIAMLAIGIFSVLFRFYKAHEILK